MFLTFRASRSLCFACGLLLAALSGPGLNAETYDYAEDMTLAGTTISLDPLSAQPATIAAIIAAVEKQSSLRFVEAEDRLPLDTVISLRWGAGQQCTLAELLAEVSNQVAVVFRRRNGLIAVWKMAKGDTVARSAAMRAGTPEPSSAATSSAAESPVFAQPEMPATTPDLIDPQAASSTLLQLDKLEIRGEVVKGSSADLRNLRGKAEVAIDFLSADQIGKYSAGDLAEAIIRIPGVSVSGGQFAVIRGLSDRYTNTTLNGLKLPSPDPEKQSPQLDILPTTLIDSIVVSKSFVPYLWADTSGGSIDLANAAVDAEGRRLSISYGVKTNENARDGGLRYAVAERRKDWLASGTQTRPGSSVSEFKQPWDFVPQHDSLPLGQKFSINYNDGFQVGERTVGFNLAVAYDIGSTQRTGEKQALLVGHTGDVVALKNSEYRTGRPTLLDGGTWDYEQSKVEVTATALASTAVKFSDNHNLRAVAFWTRNGSDSVQGNQSKLTTYREILGNGNILETQVGYDQGERRAGDYYADFAPQAVRRHRDVQIYTERELSLLQVAGSHAFEALAGMKLDWVTQRASTYQDEPNLVDARYYYQLGQNPTAASYNFQIPVGEYGIPQSGFANLNRFWGTTDETQSSFRLDAAWDTLLLAGREAKVRLGGATEETQRTFDGSNYTGIFHTLTTAQRTGEDPDEPFNNLVANETPITNRTEQTRDITAAFFNLSVDLPGRVELVAGARFERFEISTEGKDTVNRTPTGFLYHYSAYPIFGSEYFPEFESATLSTAHVTRVNFAETNWYPSLGLVYRPTDSVTFRTTVSRTSGRPSLREMAPYYNRSLESGEYVVGNPFLQSSDVSNLDTRIEWVRNQGSRYAASLFAKRIKTPIEKVFLPGGVNGEGVETWSNNPNEAELVGAEVEFSQRLGWGFTLSGNYTWIKAEVEEHPAVLTKLRAEKHLAADETVVRQLFDQPEYIANLDLSWAKTDWGTSVSLSGNAVSDVLETVGGGTVFGVSDPTLDIYDRAFYRIDLNISQVLFAGLKLKLNAANLTDPVLGSVYDPTRAPEELIRNAYRIGRSYSLTLTKTF